MLNAVTVPSPFHGTGEINCGLRLCCLLCVRKLVCNYYCGRCPLDLLLVVILVSVDGHYCAKYYGKLFAGVLSSDNGPLSPVCLPEEGSVVTRTCPYFGPLQFRPTIAEAYYPEWQLEIQILVLIPF